ncbi:probable (S)-N-methylcoclaurine 3'-hydroxylase isozyme 2 [Momordica charantia]|uniref:Probable (S)-N-methylcoclaurine 3'-hydroxylase isozyme 2 n=1 Tax=Momordica charantia TaxID=3673 RepID=A0A6J1E237_MOMCH|nr:probable (S)-N-methylcoclaurine 3'-hydroxylase isozyme 2 [Momordica charantia]
MTKMAADDQEQQLVLPILLLLASLFITLKYFRSPSSKQTKLPPGPKPWPILGNLLQIGEDAHASMTRFAQAYGPLISLRLGGQLLVVASSPDAAAVVLKTQDRLLSARYIFQTVHDEALHRECSFVFSPECNDRWRKVRSICRANLFTAKAIDSQANLRRMKMDEMVEFLVSKQGSVVEIRDFVFTTVFNILSNFIFSRDLFDFVGDGFNGIKASLKKMVTLGLTPNLADYYSLLRNLDLQGLRKKATIYRKQIDSAWKELIDERRKIHLQNSPNFVARDFLDVLIQSQFNDEQINHLIVEIFLAGTDTTTMTVEWAMAEMLKQRDIMAKVREEMKREINNQSTVDESKISQLHYLWKCVKETLRLHPPAPFLLPRVAPTDCELMGYSIPKDTLIFVNVWGIGRDPSLWEDSLSFNPERFTDCDVDFKGYDYRYLPFGGGRRICPGLPMASVQIPLILATLIHNFELSLPNGQDFSKLDLDGKLGVTLQKKKPLQLILQKRL